MVYGLGGALTSRSSSAGVGAECALPSPRSILGRLALLLTLQSVGHFFDDLRHGNVAVVRLGIDEIERIPPQADVKLVIATCRLALPARCTVLGNCRGRRNAWKTVACGNFGDRLVPTGRRGGAEGQDG